MLVRVKQSGINDFVIKGTISQTFLDSLVKEFGSDLVVEEQDDDEAYVSIKETDWYKQLAAEETPGGNLRFYRTLHHMTQTDLASRLSTTKQHISDMEHDRKPISKKTAKELSALFKISVNRFI